jgi:hypothetical protein
MTRLQEIEERTEAHILLQKDVKFLLELVKDARLTAQAAIQAVLNPQYGSISNALLLIETANKCKEWLRRAEE